MGDHYRRKIESEMDRFEAEISSLGRPGMGGPPVAPTPAFIPAQLRRPPIGGGVIAAPPLISRAPGPVTIR